MVTTVLAQSAATDPLYRVLSSQTAPANGQAMQIELFLGSDGKVQKYDILAGGVAGADPAWPDKDSVTLAENSLHYILDNSETIAAVAPFFKNFTDLSLAKATVDGQEVSKATVHSSVTKTVLSVYLKMDGTFFKAEWGQ